MIKEAKEAGKKKWETRTERWLHVYTVQTAAGREYTCAQYTDDVWKAKHKRFTSQMNKKRFVYFKRKIRLISTLTSYREKRYTPKTNYSSFKYFGGEIESSIYLDITKKKEEGDLSSLSSLDVAIRLVCCCRHRTSGGGRAGPGRGSLIRFDGFSGFSANPWRRWKTKKGRRKDAKTRNKENILSKSEKRYVFLGFFLMNRFDCLSVIQFRPIKKKAPGNQSRRLFWLFSAFYS